MQMNFFNRLEKNGLFLNNNQKEAITHVYGPLLVAAGPGSGKTSVGLQLAYKLNFTFCDTDQMIEKEQNKSISTIFENEGEEYFRELETVLIENLYGRLHQSVLSVGGGLPIREGNTERLKRLGKVVYLKATKETILKRLSGDNTRPLLAGDNPGQKIEDLLQSRAPIYETAADIIINTDERTFHDIIEEICIKAKV
jgi:shikimate kinase